MIELGVFLPVLSNGWIASTTAPRYRPTYAMNKAMTMLAEDLGFSFVLSPVKYRGMGGPTEFWDYGLESFAALDAAGGTAALLQNIAYIGITRIIASYAQCAAILDRIGTVPGTKGIMLIFPEYLTGLQEFGERVLPLMRTAKLAPPRPPRVQAEELPLGLNRPSCNVVAC